MFIRYKKSYEKIAMGLLSYMPDEQCVKTLQDKIHSYETESSMQLYLWKAGEDIIGLIGIEMLDDAYIVQDLAVNPSFRGEGIASSMITEIKKRFPDKQCESTATTKSFIEKCKEEREKEQQ